MLELHPSWVSAPSGLTRSFPSGVGFRVSFWIEIETIVVSHGVRVKGIGIVVRVHVGRVGVGIAVVEVGIGVLVEAGVVGVVGVGEGRSIVGVVRLGLLGFRIRVGPLILVRMGRVLVPSSSSTLVVSLTPAPASVPRSNSLIVPKLVGLLFVFRIDDDSGICFLLLGP